MLKLLKGGLGLRVPRGRTESTDALLPVALAAGAGDQQAVRTLIVSIGPSLLRCARAVLGSDHPDVDDVAQEAAWGLLAALPRFEGRSTVLHYACRVAVQKALSAHRRARPAARLEVDIAAASSTSQTPPSPLGAAVARHRREGLRALLAELPEPQAEALLMQAVLGYTVEEIASVAQVSPHTIRSRLQFAKATLRRNSAARSWASELLEGNE